MRAGSRFPVLITQKMTRGWGKRLAGSWARTHFAFTVKTTTAERENIHQEEVLSKYVNFTGTDHCVFSPFSHITERLDNLYSSTRRDEM